MKRQLVGSVVWLMAGLAVLGGCSDPAKKPASKDVGVEDTAGTDVAVQTDTAVGPPEVPSPLPLYQDVTWTSWSPGKVLALTDKPVRRGLRELRGLIHAHSPYSHDACDNEPFDKDGKINQACWEDFRRDFCQVRHDFVFLTDHPTHFAEHEFPDVLLYDKARGDQLYNDKSGQAFANQAFCQGFRPQLIFAGAESSESMPTGLHGHVGNQQDRQRFYNEQSKEAFDKLHDTGAVILYAHTENRSDADILDFPLDGFEMYNLHANLMTRLADAVAIAGVLLAEGETMHPDLAMLGIVYEDPIYLTRWASVLSQGAKRVTTMGSDCHRNSLPMLLADGERVDSYRRMMGWFSNHLLVTPQADGSVQPEALQAALKNRRLYGVFEVLGYPEGFDFVASKQAGDQQTVYEMGDVVPLSGGVTLQVRVPTVARLDPAVTAPELETRILKATATGWQEVALHKGQGVLQVAVKEPGAYRAEVRLKAKHLLNWLGSKPDLADKQLVWIYANALYVQ
jgi:hypothetical protein